MADNRGPRAIPESLVVGAAPTPISYEMDGKQYIAVMAGISKGKVHAFAVP